MNKPTTTKLHILFALAKAELTHGAGFVAEVRLGDTAAARALNEQCLLRVRSVAPTTITLTPQGRAFVDRVLEEVATWT